MVVGLLSCAFSFTGRVAECEYDGPLVEFSHELQDFGCESSSDSGGTCCTKSEAWRLFERAVKSAIRSS